MARAPKSPGGPVDDLLRGAFKAVEDLPVPTALARHVEHLSAPKRRPDGRS